MHMQRRLSEQQTSNGRTSERMFSLFQVIALAGLASSAAVVGFSSIVLWRN
jgi:hypothetical protein